MRESPREDRIVPEFEPRLPKVTSCARSRSAFARHLPNGGEPWTHPGVRPDARSDLLGAGRSPVTAVPGAAGGRA